jgi:glutamate dehydrogenase
MMLSRLDKAKIDAKQDLLARSAAVAGRHPGGERPGGLDAAAVAALIGRYYRHVPPEDLLDRDPQDLYGAAVAHYSLAAARPPGRAAVRVYTPTVEDEGWSSGHTVVEIVTEDMPFLVDSVANELTRQGRAIHTVIHPQFAVRRSITGELDEVCVDADPNRPPQGTLVESWMHLEIDREGSAEGLAQVQRELTRVMSDVRDVVEDWQKMRAAALRIASSLPTEPVPAQMDAAEVAEAAELLSWLADEHFTFIGYREYQLVEDDGRERLRAVPGTGLGISRPDKLVSASFDQATAQGKARFHERRLLTLTKAADRSSVHRPAYLDYIGVRTFDEAGNVTGERRFLGLLSSAAYAESVTRSPVVKRKVAEVFVEAGLDTGSHDGRDLLEILETYPRDELFQIAVRDLAPIALSVLYLQERRKLRLYLRRDDYGRYLSALVYLPRDRFNTHVRLAMQDILLRELDGESIDYTLRSTESTLARLHFVIRTPPGTDLPDRIDDEHLENLLAEATRQWEDDFADALVEQCGEEAAANMRDRYLAAVPEAYRADFPARIAVADLRRIDALPATGGLAMNLYQPLGPAVPGLRRFKLYRLGEAMSLSTLLPVLARLGVEVTDERPYTFPLASGGKAWVYDLGLRYDPALEPRLATCRQQFQDAFAAVLAGDAENDGFNQLVLGAGLTWRQAMLLRAYAKYLRQAGGAFSQEYTVQTLRTNPEIVRLLVRLFEARLDPAGGPPGDLARETISADLITRLTVELDAVESLDADRILRSMLRLIRGTLRTNYFQTDATGQPKKYLSVKLDPQAIPELPEPRPAYEIWVYSPRVEGVHLRFGRVARGGLRWSDRREDFRTEVLGLVKAQMVKNAVIVPVGAKGGFVCKRLPDPAADREAWLAEGKACYSTFIRALLDVTDNLVVRDGEQRVKPPAQVFRRDGDDPYLVVAADKGTATFSDLANSIAAEYGFWLGDAFASGGSAGYDHKAMGITARGAWESVKRHFRELSVDCQSQDITVVGIGDMSGDVFGNGMLLSRHIRLVAAFDHRHIFLDPDPDAATSYAERQRLFALPRSSWADYDPDLVSAGGGVYPRSAKAVLITDQVRARLGLPDGVVSMPPAELMRAILTAPVDLLWNGGIGTYVKAATESNAQVGDKSNDPIRVNGGELRARVVGEGGNLGLTQLGRIEYALAGGRINSDAIDNSAGVDTSDHEVNIKILLDSVAAAGDLTSKQRNELLGAMTGEVATLVLRDNYDQNVALATALLQAPNMLDVHGRLIRWMEHDGRLNRELEFLPSDKGIAERRHAGVGLTQPELAVLLAYTKIIMTDELLDSDLPEDPSLRAALHRYFPTALRQRYADRIERHPLHREIVVTCVANDMINNAGITSLFRLREETGAEPAELARAHAVATEVYEVRRIWADVEALDNRVPARVQDRMRLESRKLTERVTRWFLANRRPPLDIEKQLAQFRDGVGEVVAQLPKLLRGLEQQRLEETRDELAAAGVPEELAVAVAALPPAFAALDICEVAQDTGRSVVEVAEVYFDLADRVQLSTLLDRILALPRTDRWNSLARAALRDDLYRAHAGLTRHVLACGGPDSGPEQRFADWVRRNQAILDRTGQTLGDIAASDTWDLATLSVALRVINSLLRHSGL